MLRPIDNWFLQQEEPAKSCLEFLRVYIPSLDKRITEEWKYGLPFYYFNGKMFCYLWIHKKLEKPYIGIAEGNKINHPDLLIEKRKRIKILLIDPSKDVPIRKINGILKEVIALYK
jgi:hypothetical protein